MNLVCPGAPKKHLTSGFKPRENHSQLRSWFGGMNNPFVPHNRTLKEGKTMPRFIVAHSVPFTEEVLVKYAKEEAPGFKKR
jgi:hypothetical protein